MTKGVFSRKHLVGSLLGGLVLALTAISTAAAQDLPPVPAAIQASGKIIVGTKCDYPPEGFLDNAGTPVGVEVAMAHQIAKYAFGDEASAEIVCVTSANRVQTLLGGKVDLLIATLGITPDREKVVGFTQPYAWASQGMVVRTEDPYQQVAELDGKPVVFVKGALAIPYFDKNYPAIQKLELDGVSDALQALMTKRVEGYAHDTPVLMSLVRNNPKLRLLDQQFEITLRAAAVRPGDTELLAFVNGSLSRMASEGRFRQWFETYANDDDLEAKLNFWDMAKKPTE